jgi:hypothetical protein
MVHEQRETVQQEETVLPEVAAFSTMTARIVLRCLRRNGTRPERFLLLPAQSIEHQRGGTYDSTTASDTSSQTSGVLRQEFPAQAAGRDRRANLEWCTHRGLLPAALYGGGEFSARRAGRLVPRLQTAPGRCRSQAAQGGVRPHARPLRGECR